MITLLIADDQALVRGALAALLNLEKDLQVVADVGSGDEIVAAAREAAVDVALIDIEMPGMDGITAAEIIGEERIAPILMLTAFSQSELVERARDAGVMGYLVKPFGASEVVPAIEVAIGRFAELRAIEEELANLEDRFESRKIIDQAKGMLQEGLGLTEPEAFRWIQKTAMDLRKSMREVAEGVISHKRKK